MTVPTRAQLVESLTEARGMVKVYGEMEPYRRPDAYLAYTQAVCLIEAAHWFRVHQWRVADSYWLCPGCGMKGYTSGTPAHHPTCFVGAWAGAAEEVGI